MRLLTTQDGLPRISWGAVIAGVILSLIAYLCPRRLNFEPPRRLNFEPGWRPV